VASAKSKLLKFPTAQCVGCKKWGYLFNGSYPSDNPWRRCSACKRVQHEEEMLRSCAVCRVGKHQFEVCQFCAKPNPDYNGETEALFGFSALNESSRKLMDGMMYRAKESGGVSHDEEFAKELNKAFAQMGVTADKIVKELKKISHDIHKHMDECHGDLVKRVDNITSYDHTVTLTDRKAEIMDANIKASVSNFLLASTLAWVATCLFGFATYWVWEHNRTQRDRAVMEAEMTEMRANNKVLKAKIADLAQWAPLKSNEERIAVVDSDE